MRKYFITLSLIVLIQNYSNRVYAQTLFDYPENFEFIEEIQIPNNHIIGTIKTISIYKDSLATIVDPFSQMIYLLDLRRLELKKIDPADCHPGFELIPIHSFFLNDGSIFITNATIQGYLFNNDGSCLSSINDKFIAPYHTYINKGAQSPIHILNFAPYNPNNIFLENADKFGNILDRIKINTIEKINLSFRFEGGGIVSIDDNVYLSSAESNNITIINLKTNTINTSGIFEPDYIKPFPNEDLSTKGGPMGMMKYFQNIQRNNSLNLAMFNLNDNLILQQLSFSFRDEQKIATILYNVNQNSFLDSLKIITDDRIYWAENNYVYTIKSNQDLSDMEIVNPSILMFKYIDSD